MSKLTPKQKEAYDALTFEYQTAYDLGFSLATLNALVSKGCARKLIEPGASFPSMRKNLTSFKKIG